MKKLFALALALCLLISLAPRAHADVIWEPYDDDYYEKNQENFRHTREVFYVNSPSGSLTAFDAPGGKAIETLENGSLVYAEYQVTHSDGSTWILTEARIDDDWVSLYIPQAQLLSRYDEEFFRDHAAEITTDAPAGLEVYYEGDQVRWWVYPGGPSSVRGMGALGEEDLAMICSEFYVDPDGTVWGYVGYWMGHQDSWLCLSDMERGESTEPEIFEGTVYFGENAAPLDPDFEPDLPEDSLSPLVIILPIAAVVLAGAALLLWPRKKRRSL